MTYPRLKGLGVKCKARNGRGKRCGAWAIRGGAVCRVHGGAAPQVRAAADRRMAEYLADAIDPKRVLLEAGCIAYFDPGTLFLDDGTLKPIQEWPEAARRAVAAIEVLRRNLTSGDGKTDEVLKVRFNDKVKTLDLLAQHHNLLKMPAITGELTISWKDPETPKDPEAA